MQLSGSQAVLDGNKSRSSVSVRLDRSMNNMPLRCEATSPALDEPANASTVLSVLCECVAGSASFPVPPRHVDVRKYGELSDELVAGKDTRLQCAVPSANPPAEVSWELDAGGELPLRLAGDTRSNASALENGGFEVQNVLTFAPSVAMDGRKARCIASHPLWESAVVGEYSMNVYCECLLHDTRNA